MKRGFELLSTRELDQSIDIGALESSYSVKLPPLYRLFVETFMIGEDLIKSDKYLSPEGAFLHASYFVYEENREVMFGGFNDIAKSFLLKDEVEEWSVNGYLPIGYCGFNGGIVLGTRDGDSDKIILHDFDGKVEFVPIADNIFVFVRGLILEPINESHLKDGADFSKLYKKWGEDFWRVINGAL